MKEPFLEDTHLVEVCSRFLKEERPSAIADWLSKELDRRVSREAIYPLVREGVRRGYLLLSPPLEDLLRQRLADRFFNGTHTDQIHVASVTPDAARDALPIRAAELIVELIHRVSAARKSAGGQRVRIGLGGGGTIMRVAQALAGLLRTELKLPPLGLHVVSSGFRLKRPLTAPISFLSYFDQVPTNIEYVGLFAPAVCRAEDYERVISLPGVEESFRNTRKIDIVVTGLASAQDEHGELREFMQFAGERTREGLDALKKDGFVGELQYQPYSEKGPITDLRAKFRAVSLFDL